MTDEKKVERYMKIHVTKEDIKNGERFDCHRCPIALAATRAGLTDVDVDYLTISANQETHTLPDNAVCFIDRFDDGESVKPFTFILDVPEPKEQP